MPKAIAVLISDIHFTPATLDIATVAFKKAQIKALDLKVTLIVCGDTLDTKAIMRAECVNRLIELLFPYDTPKTFFLVGNHDLANEKGKEHTLNFLKPYAEVIDSPRILHVQNIPITFIPYQSDLEVLQHRIKQSTDIIIMHQGIKNTNAGHYFHDATAIDADWLTGKRVISGHYHTRQTTALPGGGLHDYIGNPYSLNFGEASDPEKGFQVLYDDGSLEFIPTNLRKHVVIEVEHDELYEMEYSSAANPEDSVWLKVKGPQEALHKITKAGLLASGWPENLKLDLIPDEMQQVEIQSAAVPQAQLLDNIIDGINATDDQKELLKSMWRSFQ